MKTTIFAAALSLCAAPLWAQDQVSLLSDWFVNPDHVPVTIAQEKSYFAEQNLRVEVISPADPSAPQKMGAAGQADLAISYQPELHLHIREGLPFQRVGTLVTTPLSCLLVLADGPIQTLADLKGRKFGFPVVGVGEAILDHRIAIHGVSRDDVELINVNRLMSPLLTCGQVHAVIGAFRKFELNQVDLEGVPRRCFYVEEVGLPPYDKLICLASKDTVDIDMTRGLLAATEKATQYIINHPVKSWEIFAGTSLKLNDELNKRAWLDTFPRFALRPTAMDVGRDAIFEASFHNGGLIPRVNSVSDIALHVIAQ